MGAGLTTAAAAAAAGAANDVVAAATSASPAATPASPAAEARPPGSVARNAAAAGQTGGVGWARFASWPIRHKLLALALLPLGVVLPLLGLVLLLWGNAGLDQLLVTKVRSDLAVAHGYFDRVLGQVAASTAAVADSHPLHQALDRPALAAAQSLHDLQALLRQIQAREGLDFIHLRGPDGRLLLGDAPFGAEAPGAAGSALPGSATGASSATSTTIASQAAPAANNAAPPAVPAPGAPVRATLAVWSPGQQGLLPPALRARVPVPLLPTRNAQPTPRSHEDRALVVQALAPVRAADGRLLALVQAGVLLNRNLPFIDHINAIVYPAGALPFGSHGTATLFLDDVRISTNVRLFAEEPDQAIDAQRGEARAIGTRVSQVVREAVLGRGETWLGRAFVVNDWYVSAYQPLADDAGQRVGMLYVGYLERPFTWLKYGVLASIGAVFFAVMGLAAWGATRWARQVFNPLERMARTMAQVEGGALAARVGPVAGGDEIAALAGHLDHLLDTIADKTAALERWNAQLDATVTERGAALAAAQQQLRRAEKMAAVGQLTASIAHEVNNPIAVIQGNLDLTRQLLGPAAAPVAAELSLMDQQIERMRLIVTQLLQFARPTEFAGYVEAVDCERALDDGLVLTGHLLARSGIQVQRQPGATRLAGINRHELQQVLVNLMVNAIHAMPGGGTLRLATGDWADAQGRPGVRIDVADTGPGLDAELLRDLFQPFVTRKKDGTGLGLWISHGIVERYGGDIVAANRAPAEGRGVDGMGDVAGAGSGPAGAVFSVLLLTDAVAQGTQPPGGDR